VAIYGLPPAEPAHVLPSGRSSIQVGVDAASNYVVEVEAAEAVIQDGENWRVHLTCRYGVTDRMEVGIEIPYVIHTGGFLDGPVNTWHDITGLPDGGRKNTANNRINTTYIKDGRVLINMEESSAGIGDIRVFGGLRLLGSEGDQGRSLTLRAGLKLPTGNPDDLTGSGAADLHVGVAVMDTTLSPDTGISFFGNAGILFAGGGDLIRDQQRSLVGFGSLGVGWRITDRFTPKIQVDWHSPFHQDSALSTVDAWSAQLVLGGTLSISEKSQLDMAIVEDIAVDTAPDVLFHIALGTRF